MYTITCRFIINKQLTPSNMLATAKRVEDETSDSFLLILSRRLSAVSLRPGATSQNLSVLAVHKIMTYINKRNI